MIVAVAGVSSFFVQLFFQIWLWRGLQKLSGAPSPSGKKQVNLSVIVAAHNEEKNLPTLLEHLSAQPFPKAHFEVIVAADRCTDDTAAIARKFAGQFHRLTVLEIDSVPPGVSPKKFALQRAIAAARFEHLVFLDADVRPAGEHLQTIGRYFGSGAQAVVSLMRFRPPRSFGESFLVFEKLLSWCIAGAGIARQQPVIAYGGNWAYTKSAFATTGGYGELLYSLSGDDDLLLQKFARHNLPIAMCLHPDGWVEIDPPASFAAFLRQRRRHFSAGKYYNRTLKTAYFFYHLSNLCLWLCALFSLPAAGLLAIKLLADYGIIRRGGRLFRVQLSFVKSTIFNFCYLLYNTLIGPLGHIGKIRW